MNSVKNLLVDYHNTNRFIVSNFTHEDQEKVFDKVDKPCYITIWRNVRNLIRDEFAELKLTLDYPPNFMYNTLIDNKEYVNNG